jgi:hypothetical protein
VLKRTYIITGARTLVIMRFTIIVIFVIFIIVLVKRRGGNSPRKIILPERLHSVAWYTYPASTAARSAWYRGVCVRPGWLFTTETS